MSRKVVISTFLLLVCMWFSPHVKRFFLQDSCLDRGGKWVADGAYCIEMNCADSSPCKPSYANNTKCLNLKPGITQQELFFELGMPVHHDGKIFKFTPGGGGESIAAVIENGVVTELNCGSLKVE